MAKYEGKPPGMHAGAPSPRGAADPDPRAMLANIPGAGVTKTETRYHTAIAVQIPRDLDLVEREILYEASKMGEDFIYTWEVNDKNSKTGKSRIEGVSIEGAMILARNWTNCTIPTEHVKANETASHFEFLATFIDLEKGFSVDRGFRQRKGQRTGGMDADRAEDIAYQIGWSKAQRNAIVNAIPRWLQDKAVEVAKDTAVKKYTADMPKARSDVKTYANGLGITDAELEAKVGNPIADWVPTDIVYLRSIFKAIGKKETTIGLEFRPKAAETAAAESAPAQEPPKPEGATSDLPTLTPEPPHPQAPVTPPAESKPATAAASAPEPVAPPPKPEPKPSPDDFQPPTAPKK